MPEGSSRHSLAAATLRVASLRLVRIAACSRPIDGIKLRSLPSVQRRERFAPLVRRRLKRSGVSNDDDCPTHRFLLRSALERA